MEVAKYLIDSITNEKKTLLSHCHLTAHPQWLKKQDLQKNPEFNSTTLWLVVISKLFMYIDEHKSSQ